MGRKPKTPIQPLSQIQEIIKILEKTENLLNDSLGRIEENRTQLAQEIRNLRKKIR